MSTSNKISSEIIGQKMWFKSGDETWCYDILDLASTGKRRNKSATSTPDQILSNMPGKVTKIFVKENDTVSIGQPLLVLEAMKMEYTLKSGLDTQVKQVLIQVGDQVTLGQLLVVLEKI